MFNSKLFIIVAILLLGGTLISSQFLRSHQDPIFTASHSCPDFSTGKVTIGGTAFSAGFATTPSAKAQGLSDCPHVPAQTGLYFPFSPARLVSFWMKDMRIPIDIIWIAQNQVLAIEQHIPPNPSLAESDLPHYQPPQAVDAVFEVAAGQVVDHNIQVGDPVIVHGR